MSSFRCFLEDKGVSHDIIKYLQENKIEDQTTLLQLTRADLKDLYPESSNFLTRKKLWDIITETNDGNGLDASDCFESFHKDLTKASTSTSSTCSVNSSLEDDQPMCSQSYSLKRANPSQQAPDAKSKRVKLLGDDFKLPLSKQVKKCVKDKSFLDDSLRCEFVRSCVVCLQAYCNDDITANHITELAQLMCKEVPSLRDEKPPLWPEDEEFKHWCKLYWVIQNELEKVQDVDSDETIDQPSEDDSSGSSGNSFQYDIWVNKQKRKCKEIQMELDGQLNESFDSDATFDSDCESSTKCLIRKRIANIKKSQTTDKKKQVSSSTVTVETGKASTSVDYDKHVKELEKELGKKKVNWKAVEELLSLTFSKRNEKIKSITGKKAVDSILQHFPFLDEQTVLLHELVLHVSQYSPSQLRITVSKESFMKLWPPLAKCFVPGADTETQRLELMALKEINSTFSAKPILVELPEGEEVDTFVKNLEGPVLVHWDATDGAQMFLALDKDVLCEIVAYSGEYSLYSTSVVCLLAAYFVFNRDYGEAADKTLFRFLEEHVLGIIQKRKSYLYKQIENKVLARFT